MDSPTNSAPQQKPAAPEARKPEVHKTGARNAEVPNAEAQKFEAQMPAIPGVEHKLAAHPPRSWTYVAVAALVVSTFTGAWWLIRTPSGSAAPNSLGADAPPVSSLPEAPAETHTDPNDIGSVAQFTEPWSSKEFMYSRDLTREKLRAVVVRLPGGNEHSVNSYWAFLLQEPYGQCQLEYVSDLQRIADKFAFTAQHPMVVNGCTASLYDPTKMATLPTGAWVRGEIVKGPGFRPPFNIELRIEGDHLIAGRAEE